MRSTNQAAAVLAAAEQPNASPEERRNRSIATQELVSKYSVGGEQAAASAQSSGPSVQPISPDSAGGRNSRSRHEDTENVNPLTGSRTLEAVLKAASQPPSTPNAAGDAGRSVGRAAGNMAAFGAATLAANQALTGLANTVLQANAGLGEYNGEIAAAIGLAQASQMRRNISQGQTIGPEYARLAEAQSKYRDTMTEIQAPLQSAAIEMAALMAETRNALIDGIAPALIRMAKIIEDLADKYLGEQDDEDELKPVLGALGFLSDVSDGKFDGFGTSYLNPGNRPLMSDADRQRIFGGSP